MKKTVHVHLHEQQQAPTRDADGGEGRWVTINGTHVQIKDGKIAKGPAGAVGKGVQEGFDHLASKDHKKKDVEHPKGPEGKVHVVARKGATVRGVTHGAEAHMHMSTGLAAHHAEKGDLMHHSETSKGRHEEHSKKAAEHHAAAKEHAGTPGE